ncbi:MAG: DUF58 domain-containing protein [Acidimicrobiales bacterium]|nr:DUF58 domain-containing protein [Acidimicrobiales bacterium]
MRSGKYRAERVRPGRPVAPLLGAGIIVGAWWLVAHNSGDGWVQTLGDLVFGVLLVGVLGPAFAVSRARIEVVSSPADAVSGSPVEVEVRVSSRVRILPCAPSGPEQMVGGTSRSFDDGSHLVLIPARRGVHHSIIVEAASAAPFGLQWWTRRIELYLPHPLHVSPRRGRPLTLPRTTDDGEGNTGWARTDSAGELRTARPYRAGDRRGRVHWPASAHAGELMIRETETPRSRPVTLVVRLPGHPDEAERAAEQALATLLELLDRDTPTLLATDEPGGTVVATVTDRRQAGRRLARAVAGDAAPPGETGRAGPAAWISR